VQDSTFVRQVADRLRCDERRAETITRLVFREIADRFGPVGARRMASYLPAAVQPLWSERDPMDVAAERTWRFELLCEVMLHGGLIDSTEAERAVVAVFATLQRFLDRTDPAESVATQIFDLLPPDLEVLWRAAKHAAASLAVAP
jgi:uncharacterized protein (DUF2267 family)